GHNFVADLDPRSLRTERQHLAGDLVTHREWQLHTTRFQRNLPAIAEIEMPVPYVDVAVADAGGLNPQQHLLAFGFGIGVVARFERLAPFDDLHRAHTIASRLHSFRGPF